MAKIIPYIRQYRESDIAQIVALSDKEFGTGYLTLEHLKSFLGSDTRFCFVVDLDSVIIGFSLFEVCDTDQIHENNIIIPPEYVTEDGLYGLVKTIAVETEYRFQGIGTTLVRVSLNQLKELTRIFVSVVWDKANNQKFTRIFDEIEMSFTQQIKNYWIQDSMLKGYNCVYCGLPPCKCNARIYFLNLN